VKGNNQWHRAENTANTGLLLNKMDAYLGKGW